MANDDYVFNRASETPRLQDQARRWEEATRPILERIGLKKGMTCLDVGCGPGEVMKLMGEMVGPSGRVVGLDIDGAVGRQAVETLNRIGSANYSFVEQDLANEVPLPGAFDVTFARTVLIHVLNPQSLLRRMYRATKPGGTLLVQDANMTAIDIQPRPTTWPVVSKLFNDLFAATGKDSRFGLKLPLHFVGAGVGAPDETAVYGIVGWLEDNREWVISTVQSLVPAAIKAGIATDTECRSCLDELTELANTRHTHVFSPGLVVSAWKRKSSDDT
jgi:ubiquinone/menaquinone biosynthesis C-methylase UbiE